MTDDTLEHFLQTVAEILEGHLETVAQGSPVELARVLAQVQRIEEHARGLHVKLSAALAASMPPGRRGDDVPFGDWMAHRNIYRGQNWEYPALRPSVRDKVIKLAAADPVTGTYDAEAAKIAARVYDDTVRVWGEADPKITELTKLGLDPDQYREKKDPTVTVKVEPLHVNRGGDYPERT